MEMSTLHAQHGPSIPDSNYGKIPLFLKKEFFEISLAKHFKNMRIKNLKISMGSNIGENYFSSIYRVEMDFEFEQCDYQKLSLIVKYLPIEGRRQFGETLNIYPKEIEMYSKIIPKLEGILNKYHEFFAPKYFATTPDPNRTIILHDIKSTGYSLANRQIGLDELQSILVLKKIATFHALSMVLSEKHPDAMANFRTGFIDKNNSETSLQKNIFEGNIECIANIVKFWPGYEQISNKLLIIKKHFMEKCLQIVQAGNEKFKVLNHGDLHLNNVMFKYEHTNGNPLDVIFLDFQLCHYASLGLDINYFLNTSVQLNVLKKKRNDLVKLYHYNLKKTLSELNYKHIPSWCDVCNEILLTEFYGFFAFEGILPTISMSPNDCKFNNVDKYSNADTLNIRRKIMFKTDRFDGMMKYSLKRFDELGILD